MFDGARDRCHPLEGLHHSVGSQHCSINDNDTLTNLGYDGVKVFLELLYLGERRLEVLQLSVCDGAEKDGSGIRL